VEAVVTKLRNVGALENTYVVFTSDNGWHHGEHRIFNGKRQPYEESARVPLLVRGPGVGAGSTTDKLALNTDFFPTFMELAGAQTQTPSYVDGRSLRPVLDDSATPPLGGPPSCWRRGSRVQQPRVSTPSARAMG
jgi:N-acetylglucosamine-6-sulfatase